MLVPIQTSGSLPPLFALHGLKGRMDIGSSLTEALGADQPIHAIIPDGWTGQEPVTPSMEAMISAYADQVRTSVSAGPVRILGLCHGSFAAIELARALKQQGWPVGPPILIDPPPVIPGFNKLMHEVNPEEPQVARQRREQLRRALLNIAATSNEELFFSPSTQSELETAITAGLAVEIALCRHVPKPYLGPTALIISENSAATFFHPQMHWQYVLPNPRMVHVLPWDHWELFRSGRETLLRSIKYMLEASPAPAPRQQVPARPAQQSVFDLTS